MNHGSSQWLNWKEYDAKGSTLLRAYSGSIFSYYGYGTGQDGGTPPMPASYKKPWYTRAVIVVGNGF